MIVKEAVAVDKKNRNTFWKDAIQKGMENVKISFQPIPEGEKPSNGCQHVNCNRLFKIKMEDLHRNACLVVV